MHYKKVEEYRFYMPREYKAYLAFRDRLNDMKIRYIEEGGHTMLTISIIEHGDFNVDDKCDILSIIKEKHS